MMRSKSRLLFALALISLGLAYRAGWLLPTESVTDPRVVASVSVPDLPRDLELLESVFWEPDDTESLRRIIRSAPELVAGRTVLDIGTGSGLLALCCCQAEAEHVTATDVNPQAVECAKHNAQRLGFDVDVRLASIDDSHHASAFSCIGPGERFDVVISNPPWENGKPDQWSDHALYDPDFKLLHSILADAKPHLNPGGKILLAYGCVQAIRLVHRLAAEHGYDVVVLDDRDLDSLPPVFLPGMTLGLSPHDELEP